MPNSDVVAISISITPQVSVSYVPDVFGLNRRTVGVLESAGEQVRFALVGDAYHAERQCGCRGDPGGVLAGADCRDPSNSSAINTNMLRNHARPVREGLCQPARGRRAGIPTRASRRHPAAAAQATGPTARPAGGAGRRLPQPGSARRVRAFEPATAAGIAVEPAVAARGATPGRAPGRGEPARRQRPNRHRRREPAAEYHADGRCRQHGAGRRSGVRRRHGLLGFGRAV